MANIRFILPYWLVWFFWRQALVLLHGHHFTLPLEKDSRCTLSPLLSDCLMRWIGPWVPRADLGLIKDWRIVFFFHLFRGFANCLFVLDLSKNVSRRPCNPPHETVPSTTHVQLVLSYLFLLVLWHAHHLPLPLEPEVGVLYEHSLVS